MTSNSQSFYISPEKKLLVIYSFDKCTFLLAKDHNSAVPGENRTDGRSNQYDERANIDPRRKNKLNIRKLLNLKLGSNAWNIQLRSYSLVMVNTISSIILTPNRGAKKKEKEKEN